jgi:hypothetical protein
MPNPNLDPSQGEGKRGAERDRDPGADPERNPDPGADPDRLAAEEAAMRVEEEPPS